MNYRSALTRAVRTFLQGCLATLGAFFLAVKDEGTFINIRAHGAVLAYGFFMAALAALIAFIQNLLEPPSVPKG